MALCPNCATDIGCSCNLQIASDGARVCKICKADYESKKNNNRVHPPANTQLGSNLDPQITSVKVKRKY